MRCPAARKDLSLVLFTQSCLLNAVILCHTMLMSKILTAGRRLLLMAVLLLAGPACAALSGMTDMRNDWRTASRESAGIAPDPATTPEAIIQVYGARAFAWRGAFAVHTWIAYKRDGAPQFVTYEVVGWNQWYGRSPLSRREGTPDRRWYGAVPEIYAEVRGPGVEQMIDRLEAAVAAYPFADQYRTWPGPNSNTFTAVIARALPELRLDLPPTAVGKDYLGPQVAAGAPSGTGYQLSLLGVLGLMAATEEGLEVNLLGLTFGIDPFDLALKLPGVGRLGGTSE